MTFNPQNPFVQKSAPSGDARPVSVWSEILAAARGSCGDAAFGARLDLAVLLSERVHEAGGRAVVVGGLVRDLVMRLFGYGSLSKDVDIEVFGLDENTLKPILDDLAAAQGPLSDSGYSADQVGRSYGVFKFFGMDVALARREEHSAPGKGRKPKVTNEPSMDFAQAARRRDLTINAMGLDVLTGELLDPYGGLVDVQRKRLRHVDAETFVDDPLRVYRVMQFAGRFGFEIDPATAELCRKTPLEDLAKERVGEEWIKMLLTSPRPSLGLKAALELGILRRCHPGLDRLPVVSSGADGVWCRTLRGLDAAALIVRLKGVQESGAKRLLFSVLCQSMVAQTGFAGHSELDMFMDELRIGGKDRLAISATCRSLVQAERLAQIVGTEEWNGADDCMLRRLAVDLGRAKSEVAIGDAVLAVWAVRAGRLEPEMAQKSGLLEGYAAGEALVERAQELGVAHGPPNCILTGEDLAALGIPSGPRMGEVLKIIFDKQLAGDFDGQDHLPDKGVALEFARNLSQ